MGTTPSHRNVLLGTAIPSAKIIVGDVFSDIDDTAIYKCTSVTPVTIVELTATGSPGAHVATHENDGGDEISLTGLAGLLADDQHVLDDEVTAVAVAKAILTTKGDILAASGASTPVRVGVGANDTVLTADLAETAGVKWAAAGGDVGGLYGMNVETLADAKTLTPSTDEIYQYLDEGGANRIITLATVGATAGDRFVIRHNGDYNDDKYLQVKQAAIELDKIYAGAIKEFVFDGTNWVSRGVGTGENDLKQYNISVGQGTSCYSVGVAIGLNAVAYNSGIAIGQGTNGSTNGVAVGRAAAGNNYGVAVGRSAEGYTYGVAIGRNAKGHSYGVALGYDTDTNAKRYSIALGYYSETERYGETSVNINGTDSDQENNVIQGRWEITTANATPVEMFCAGQANQRFLVRASSVLAFKMIITARDNVAGHVAMWTVADGCIKRDAAGNTTLLSATVVEVQDESTDWTVTVTADDTNEALIITVTGDGTNATQFAGVMNGVETHF